MRHAEDRHWWYAVLRGLVAEALQGRVAPEGRVLDAGCGTGGMLACLREVFPKLETEGIDASELAVAFCRERGLEKVRQGRVEALPFAEGTFDAVVCLDVLYHREVDEARALAELLRVLKPGGVLVLNLPAFDCLRGAHDVAVCGARRYTRCQVRNVLKVHRIKLEMIHYWNAWLFVPLYLRRRWTRPVEVAAKGVVSDLAPLPAWADRALAFIGRWDARLCRVLGVPFGSSVFAVARKAGADTGRSP
ncbi:MAG: methyltransferase domain-containing protein [Prosthecobacter sp.]